MSRRMYKMEKFKSLYLWLYKRQCGLVRIMFLFLIPAALNKFFADALIVLTLALYLLFSYGSQHGWWRDA